MNQQNQTSNASIKGGHTNTSPSIKELVGKRTHEIATLAGRTPPYVIQEDYELAKFQITGEMDPNLQNKAIYG